MLLMVSLIKKIKKIEWILLVHDVYPEAIFAAGITKKKGVEYFAIEKIFSHCYRSADKLIAIGCDMKDIIITKKGVPEKRVKIIQNWASDENIKPIQREKNEINKELKIQDDDFVFVFFGNMGRLQGIPNLLASAREITIPAIKILFIGSGYFHEQIKNAAENSENKNIMFYGEISSDKKNIGLTAGDVAIVSLEKNMYGLGVPSKTYFSMLADKPILAVMDKGTEVESMIAKHNIGWNCPPGNPKELALLMEQIYLTRNDWRNKIKPRKILDEFYSEEIALNKIFAFFKE